MICSVRNASVSTDVSLGAPVGALVLVIPLDDMLAEMLLFLLAETLGFAGFNIYFQLFSVFQLN